MNEYIYFLKNSMIKIMWILCIIYLAWWICMSLYWVYEWHRENKRRWYRLEKYNELFVVVAILTLSRPFILYINIKDEN